MPTPVSGRRGASLGGRAADPRNRLAGPRVTAGHLAPGEADRLTAEVGGWQCPSNGLVSCLRPCLSASAILVAPADNRIRVTPVYKSKNTVHSLLEAEAR